MTPEECWKVIHNRIADREAVAANLRRPHDFWDLHNKHVAAVEFVNQVNYWNRKVLLGISQAVVRDQELADNVLEENTTCYGGIPLPNLEGSW